MTTVTVMKMSDNVDVGESFVVEIQVFQKDLDLM
jgi:hypothetical protein